MNQAQKLFFIFISNLLSDRAGLTPKSPKGGFGLYAYTSCGGFF